MGVRINWRSLSGHLSEAASLRCDFFRSPCCPSIHRFNDTGARCITPVCLLSNCTARLRCFARGGGHTPVWLLTKALPQIASVANQNTQIRQIHWVRSTFAAQLPTMASPSPSTPSEGEIVESDLEKAKPSIVDVRGTSVDRQSRKRASVSRTPTPDRSTRQYRSRTRSRSPYREPRGAKRPHEDTYADRTKDDPRRFKIRYEDRPFEDRRRPHNRDKDISRQGDTNQNFRYDDRGKREGPREKRQRTRSRSPRSARPVANYGNGPEGERGKRSDGRGRPNHSSKGHRESNSRLSNQQSVSDRGHSSVAAAYQRREAETANIQKQHTKEPGSYTSPSAAEYVKFHCSRLLLMNL